MQIRIYSCIHRTFGEYLRIHQRYRRWQGTTNDARCYRLLARCWMYLPAWVGKYRSSSYLRRQSRHNLRRVRCARRSTGLSLVIREVSHCRRQRNSSLNRWCPGKSTYLESTRKFIDFRVFFSNFCSWKEFKMYVKMYVQNLFLRWNARAKNQKTKPEFQVSLKLEDS